MAESSLVKILNTVKDKNGEDVVIKLCNQTSLGPHDLMSFFYKSLAELLDNNHGSSWPSYNTKTKAVYAEINNKIVGHIFFNYGDVSKSSFIVLSAVDKDFRNRGIYKLLHHEFEEVSKKLGAHQITSFVHVNNKARLASAKSVDYNPVFYKMTKKL